MLWRAIPVDELLQADSPLLDEGFLEDALVSSERQQSFQGRPGQRRNYNLEGELRVNVFRYISTQGHKKKRAESFSLKMGRLVWPKRHGYLKLTWLLSAFAYR